MNKLYRLILTIIIITLPFITFGQELENFQTYYDNKENIDDIEGIYICNYQRESITQDTYNFSTDKSNDNVIVAIKGYGTTFNLYIFNQETNLFRKWDEMTILKSNKMYVISMKSNNYYNLKPFSILSDRFTLSFSSRLDLGTLKVESDYKYEVVEKIYPKEKHTKINKNGTCFLISSEGYLITNYHVIKDAKNIYVTITNNQSKKIKAELIHFNSDLDIALLKIKIPYVKIPFVIKNKTTDVGTSVFTLGFPLTQAMGNEIKLSVGIVNSKSGFKGDTKYYQISNPIQPGNSGGPLFDNQGNLIGLVTSKYTGGDNVGYALKSSLILNYLESLDINLKLNQINSISTLQLQGKFKTLKEYVFWVEVE